MPDFRKRFVGLGIVSAASILVLAGCSSPDNTSENVSPTKHVKPSEKVIPEIKAESAEILQKKAETANSHLLKSCNTDAYQFTPKVRAAFLAHAKAQAAFELASQDKRLPTEFLKWVDADPIIEASVYGTSVKPSEVLLHLYSLKLDLGEKDFRTYHQLMLAESIVNTKLKEKADITPREPLVLTIAGDPRIPVNTKDTNRELDMNDHIINFLNDNTIEADVVVGHKLPELKYDDRGIAIPAPKKQKKVPVVEEQTRTLYAADVIASKALQTKFNTYMKSKGHDVSIDCGENVVHWKSRDGVKGKMRENIRKAHDLFHNAYKAKGLMPKKRDPFPTPGEQMRFFIRNYEHTFSEKRTGKQSWPKYPLTAPWPTLVMLTSYDQPLRECEERWKAFRDKGVFKTYGEYIGGIAQQFDMQSARRIKPYPFTYGTIQMMLKDGGVCGTMGNISVRTHTALGVPATTAGQPGHCAMVAYRFDPKTKTYQCKGGQYATGGDDKTTPHAGWFFGNYKTNTSKRKGKVQVKPVRKMMIYHQSVAWAVNYGMPEFMDSLMVHTLFRMLPEADRKGNGMALLQSGLKINPYSFALVDSAQALATTPQELIAFWDVYKTTMSTMGTKPGCPKNGLYNKTVKKNMFARITKLPLSKNTAELQAIYSFLEKENCQDPVTLATYFMALNGLPALQKKTEGQYTQHLKTVHASVSKENDIKAAQVAEIVKTTANMIKKRKGRVKWVKLLFNQAKGQEKYFANRYKIATVPAVSTLAKLARQKLPADTQLIQPILDGITVELQKSVTGTRNLKSSKPLAAKITGAAKSLKDPAQKKQWLTKLSATIKGKEKFKNGRRNVTDPCATAIKKLGK